MRLTIMKVLIPILVSFSFFSPISWAEDETPAAKVPIYYLFPDPFTINFLRQSKEKARYLQIKVALMSYDQEVISNAENNLPMLQDALRSLFTEQSMESVSSVDGRKAIQATALAKIKTILKEETGNDSLEAVYFTSFILQ